MTKSKRRRLLNRIQCPSCWGVFEPGDTLHVAQNPELVGDDLLGPEEYKRFAAKHFTVDGKAYDEKGAVAEEIACPSCHFRLGEPLFTTPVLFMSVIGSPASGKSYFLASMVEGLMTMLPQFDLGFGDADPVSNEAIHSYQKILFHNPVPEKLTQLDKTQQAVRTLYRQSKIDGLQIMLPVPMQFMLNILPSHPYAKEDQAGRIFVLYDNAGEDYIATKGSTHGTHAIRHVAHSNFLIMLYDLTQDQRWMRQWGRDVADDVDVRKRLSEKTPMVRQDTILRMVTSHVRKQRDLQDTEQTNHPLCIVVPKFDLWASMLGIDIDTEPFVEIEGKKFLDMQRIRATSKAVRSHLLEVCPEFIATAESFSSAVTYVPLSALGSNPGFTVVQEDGTGFFGICPKNIAPHWATIPVLSALANRNVRLLPLAPSGGTEA